MTAKRKKAIALLTLLLAAIVAAAVLVAYAFAPKNVIKRAVEKTMAAATRPSDELLEQAGLAATLKTLQEGPVRGSVYLGSPSVVGMEGQELGLAIEVDADREEKLLAGTGVLQLGRVPVLKGSFAVQDELARLEVPRLYKEALGVDTATIGAAWNRSAMAQGGGVVLNEELGFDLFGDAAGQWQAALYQLAQKAEVYRAGRAMAEQSDGQIQCSKIGFSVTQEAANSFVAEARKAGHWDILAAMMGLAWPNEPESSTAPLAILRKAFDKTNGEKIIDDKITGEALLHNGYIVAVEVAIPLRIGGAPQTLTLKATFDWTGDLLHTARLEGWAEGGRRVLEREMAPAEDGYTVEWLIQMEEDGMPLARLQWKASLSAGTAHGLAMELAGEADMTGGEDEEPSIGFGVKATMEAGVGQSLFAWTEDAYVKLGKQRYDWVLEYGLAPIQAVEPPDGEPVMILELNETEWEELKGKMNLNYFRRLLNRE